MTNGPVQVHNNIDDVPLVDPGESTGERARREADALTAGRLEEEARKQAHKHRLEIGSVVHWSVILFMVLAAAALGTLIIAWAWHFIGPCDWDASGQMYCWLPENRYEEVRAMLFSAVMAAAASAAARKYLRD